MIQDIFLPEKFGTYYLFSQRVVGIDVTKTHVHATVLSMRGSIISVEKCITEPLNSNKSNHAERVIEALGTVMQQVGTVTKVHVSLPSSSVVFKEMRLPFTEYDKINMVIRFEAEPLLPFTAQDAVIDFIITDIDKDGTGSQVLVAAAQKQTIAEQLSLFEQAHIDPDIITVDMFALYGLYTQIPTYEAQEGTVILLVIDAQTTRMLAIHNKQPRIIRTLPHGIYHIAKEASSAIDNATPKQIMDHLIRFGLEKSEPPELAQAVQNSLTTFFDKIHFALNSTLTQLQNTNVSKILLLGPGMEIKGLTPFAQEKLQFPCELFDIQKLTENKRYRIRNNTNITQATVTSLAAAVPSPIMDKFNLRRGVFEPAKSNLLLKQLITAGILLVILFTALIAHNIIQTRRLKHEIQSSQTEAIEELKSRFPNVPEDEDDFDDVIESAKTELSQEESIWLAFSSQSRASFLEYLLALSTKINKAELGLVPEQLTIMDGLKGEITLKAKVRDFEALKQLEDALRRIKLFSYVEGQTTTDFTMKILLAQNN